VFFISIAEEFKLNREVTSGIFSAYMAFSAIFSIPGSWFLDKYGPKRTMAAMGVIAGLSLVLTSQMHSAWQLFLTYSFLLALGTGIAHTVMVTAISKWFDKKRGLALGIGSAGGGLGTLAFAPFATFLIINLEWRIAYILLGIIAFVLVVSFSMLLKGSPAEMGLLPDGAKQAYPKSATGPKKVVPATGFSLKEAARTKQFWILFILWLFHGTTSYMISTHIVPHAIDMGISDLAAANILGVFSIFNVIGGLTAGALSDIIGRKMMAVMCAFIGAAAMFWLLWIPSNLWLLYTFAALFGIPFGGISILVSAMAGDFFGTRSLGKIMGSLGLSWFAGAAIGPLIAGIVYDMQGSYFYAFLIGGICMVMVILLLLILPKPKGVQGFTPVREKLA
jgi:OFA family oxalate/formate antiporter-like MFS transporter